VIKGKVRGRDAIIRLKVFGPEKSCLIDSTVDTGFTNDLTLPREMIAELNLAYNSTENSWMADGREITFATYHAIVEWDGSKRNVIVHETVDDILIGMDLLHGYELKMQVRHNGRVTIRKLGKK
jgi:clan AA aspartic protease